MTAMGITCKQATDYISRKEEGKLSLLQRFRLWRHLGMCSLCRLFSTQNQQITGLLKQEPQAHSDRLNEQEKQKIIQEVAEYDS